MKRFLIILVGLLICSSTINAQVSYKRQGNTFASTKSNRGSGKEPTKTKYTWQDSEGKSYSIYMGSTGSCFVMKVSKKTGKEYRYYLGKDISTDICNEMGVDYKYKTKLAPGERPHMSIPNNLYRNKR